MLEGKVAVDGGEEGSEQRETRVESSTATLPSFGHSAYSPAKACRTANQGSFTETEMVPFVTQRGRVTS